MDTTVLPGGVELSFDDARPVAWVRLARPEVRNAQTMATWASLAQAADMVDERPDLSLVVLQGEGADFSAGLDVRMLRGAAPTGEGDLRALLERDDAAVLAAIAQFQRGFTCWREVSPIVIAAVSGNAIGAGFQLALAADLRVLSDDASLAMAEARLGLVPDLGGTRRLVEIIGYPRALRLCATGEPVDASRAQQLGLADAVFAGSAFGAGLEELMTSLLTVPAVVSRSIKSLIRSATVADPADQLAAERRTQLPLLRRLGSSG